ncbi:phage terminase small subunit [Oceanisphaera psychrotolerans]|uniref:Terminase n=1 Tax=Oceanisphaera psychrotolerans TaxID=1414654 RepID=A0A1J4QCH7_9GAMM|nr:phage terminase small subunit [Oceanisphaera psychrotolerans]OIN09087.1 terminase [Oceanisphaera psychrotolerans]
MSTPAQRHRDKHRALQAAQQAADTGQAAGELAHSLHLQLLALEQDQQRLKALDRIADKVTLKRELLPKYRPYVEQYLTGEKTHQNPLFATLVVWLFDLGEFEQALDWAEVAIAQGQHTPTRMKRDFPHFVADTVLEWAEQQAAEGQAVEPYFSRVFRHVASDWRLNEKLTAKYFKFAGLLLLRDAMGEPRPSAVTDPEVLEQADALLVKAHEWDPVGAQVKTHRNRIAMRLRALEQD